jgi:hypothetical protein
MANGFTALFAEKEVTFTTKIDEQSLFVSMTTVASTFVVHVNGILIQNEVVGIIFVSIVA